VGLCRRSRVDDLSLSDQATTTGKPQCFKMPGLKLWRGFIGFESAIHLWGLLGLRESFIGSTVG
jgi:hypothetical protein